MPKRTNTFQSVISMVTEHLAGNAVVTEPAMLTDLVSGESREVDITIESTIAGYPVIISLECRDHSRTQSVGWVEEMNTKHDRLPTNRLVLVSNSGFTKGALLKAASFDIETITVNELTDAEAGALVNRLNTLWFKGCEMSVTKVRALAEKTDCSGEEIVDTYIDNNLYSVDGEFVGTMIELAQGIMNNLDMRDQLRDATEEVKHFTIEIEQPKFNYKGKMDRELFLEKIDPHPHLKKVIRLRIDGDAKVIASEIPMTHAEFKGTAFSYGVPQLEKGPAVLVVTNGGEGGNKMSIKIGTKVVDLLPE